jgi:hypothetical protein
LLKGEEAMNQEMQMTTQEAIRKLLQYGFTECTERASRQDGTDYLCAFERLGDEKHISYCCSTIEDLRVLVSLAEASALP